MMKCVTTRIILGAVGQFCFYDKFTKVLILWNFIIEFEGTIASVAISILFHIA